MEVQCERCQTEYDFDDALVSERGTTVKCTHCGHQFRIFRPKAAAAAPERWEVRTRSGQEFIFNSLRELQRSITRGLVERDDTLIRSGLSPKVLSSIAELEPFFPSTVNRAPTPVPPRPGEGRAGPTRKDGGMALDATQPAIPPVAPPPVLPIATPPPGPAAHIRTLPGGTTAPVRPQEALPKDLAALDRESVTTQVASGAAALEKEPPFEPETVRRRPGSGAEPPRAVPPVEASKTVKAPADQVEAPREIVIREKPDLTPTPSDIRALYASPEESRQDVRYVPEPRKGSTAVRLVIAAVVIGAVAVGGLTLGKRYLYSASAGPAPAASLDPRVADFLRDGDKKLLDGDLEGAKESFDKATALAESDVRVQVQRARWANVKADLSWLKLRLVAPDQPEVVAVARRELDDNARKAQEAAQKALDLAPEDAAAVRVRIDAYRLSGDLASGRKLVSKISSSGSDPEVAYVLAALELAEQSPTWTTAIERLRVAAAGEQNLGRARGALVYALASAGQPELALAELETLSKAPRPYPLLLEAKGFVARSPARKDGGAGDGGVDTSSLPLVPGGGAAEGAELQGSYQDLLARAHAAQAAGDLAKAEQLYRAVLARNPQDTEALSGLGDIARAKGDKAGSVKYYEDVAKQNPGYIPALVGMADAKWDAGDKAGAVAIYKQILDKTGGQGFYADKARQRIAAAGSAPATTASSQPTAPPAASTAAPPAATPAPTATEAPTSTAPAPPPGADTSDLPGWKP